MNSLTLIIVNEGADYQQRLAIARNEDPAARFRRWALRVSVEVAAQRRAFGSTYTITQMAEAVVELDAYYQRHIAEGA